MTRLPVAVSVIQRKIREPDSESSLNSDSNSDSDFENNTDMAESSSESEEGDNTPMTSTSNQAGEWFPDPLLEEEERGFDDPGPDGSAPISPDLSIPGKDQYLKNLDLNKLDRPLKKLQLRDPEIRPYLRSKLDKKYTPTGPESKQILASLDQFAVFDDILYWIHEPGGKKRRLNARLRLALPQSL
jgi:hypothetical protein